MKKVAAVPVTVELETKAGLPVSVDAVQTFEVSPPAPSVEALAAEAAALDAGAPSGSSGEPLDGLPAESAPPIPSSELLRPLLDFAFGVYAPRWKVTALEIDKLAGAYGAVVDKYFPDGIAGKYALEINALLITFAVFQPRFSIPPRDAAPPSEKPAVELPVNQAEPSPTVQ
jgi:hypothetical protein